MGTSSYSSPPTVDITACSDLLASAAEPSRLGLDLRGLYASPAELDTLIAGVELELAGRRPELETTDAQGTALLGFLYHYGGDPERALELFGELGARDPDDPVARGFLEAQVQQAAGER